MRSRTGGHDHPIWRCDRSNPLANIYSSPRAVDTVPGVLGGHRQEAATSDHDSGDRVVKAISLWQPWASLIALGPKTIETRSWATDYRGPLAIHAAKRQPEQASRVGDYVVGWQYKAPSHPVLFEHPIGKAWPVGPDGELDRSLCTVHDLPLGAVVATCRLVDCLPMFSWATLHGPSVTAVLAPGPAFDSPGILLRDEEFALGVELPGPGEDVIDVSGQIPYGDFSPGRYAWLLDDIKPVEPPMGATGHRGLWNWQLPKEAS